jgi:pimeloyl-ACP methyl ester carboxylesterase
MAKLLTMPRLGETMEQGTVRSWLVKEGVPYKRGDVIAEIETDKTVVEFPALEDGVVARFVAGEGDVVTVGAALAELAGDDGAPLSSTREGSGVRAGGAKGSSTGGSAALPPSSSAAVKPSSPVLLPAGRWEESRPLASPAARKLAKRHGLDLRTIPATGRQGRVQGWDVRAALLSHATVGTSDALHFSLRGEGDKTPIVLLHGFGGDKDGWLNLAVPLAQHRKVISLDLPGHGGSLAHKARSAGAMPEAVLATLRHLSIGRAHLVGHSMGGAVALSTAIADPSRIASLTLFAPGAIGPEINHRLLLRFAMAQEEKDAAVVLEQFFGQNALIPRGLAAAIAEARRAPGASEALTDIAMAMVKDGAQRCIPGERLAALAMPVRVIWGDEDRVLPAEQSRLLPGLFAVHRYPRIGHMPQAEVGRDALRFVQMTIAGE